jgi:hypothetical protein
MKTDETKIKPCPFCGTRKEPGQWTMTNGFKEVSCSCGASAPLNVWNKRYSSTAAILDEALNSGKGTYTP